MAFYKDAKPRKMSKQDHLRQMSKWEDEGERYRKATSPRRDDEEKPFRGKGGNHFGNKPFGRPEEGRFERKGERSFAPSDRFEKKDERSFGRFEKKDDRSFTRQAGFDRKPAFRTEERPAPRPVQTEKPAREERPRFDDVPENLLSGRNPIREAIKAGRDIEKLLVAKGELSGSAREIVEMAKEARIPVQIVERTRLDEITRKHQGMLAFASAYRYAQVEDMLAEAREQGEDPFLIILDGVTDPQNLGAIIRTAACVGAHGVIVPERRAVGLTPVAVKASAGAVEVVKVARVTNLNRTLDMLKKEGIWLYAADMKGETYLKCDLTGPIALVIGSEGEGVSRLVMENCDHCVSLPMSGKLDSLNASVAAGVLMYAVNAARGTK